MLISDKQDIQQTHTWVSVGCWDSSDSGADVSILGNASDQRDVTELRAVVVDVNYVDVNSDARSDVIAHHSAHQQWVMIHLQPEYAWHLHLQHWQASFSVRI